MTAFPSPAASLDYAVVSCIILYIVVYIYTLLYSIYIVMFSGSDGWAVQAHYIKTDHSPCMENIGHMT